VALGPAALAVRAAFDMHELLERARAWSVELWARVFLIVALVVTSLYGLSCVPAKFWHDLVWCLWALIVGSVCFCTPYLITCLPFWPIWSWITKVQYLCVSFFASLWLFLAQPVGLDLVELTFRAIFPEKAWFFQSVNALLGAANSVSTSIATLVLSEAFHVSRWKMRALVPTVAFGVSLLLFLCTIVGTAFGLWRMERLRAEARAARIAARRAESNLAESEAELAKLMQSLGSLAYDRAQDADEESLIKSEATRQAAVASNGPSSIFSRAKRALGTAEGRAGARDAAATAASAGGNWLFRKLVGADAAAAFDEAEVIESASQASSAEAAASLRIMKLREEANRPLQSLEIKTAVPLTSYLAGASSIIDDGRDAFSQANYQGAFVLLTRYVTFSSQMVPKHREYAGAEASEGRATLESEVHRVNTEELPTVLGELKRQILDEERGRRKLSNKWW